jgi:glycosyltransferase involved in cell wall biosynthesis
MMRPASFDRAQFRRIHGLGPDDVVLVFMALGHFERKGLPLLLEAMTQVQEPNLKLSVVGGEPGLIRAYQQRVASMGLAERVVFVGMQQDVRPFLWQADAFIFPSAYEVFPLVALEAAAAGLPLIASRLNGVEELLRDGENGFQVQRTVPGVVQGIRRFLSLGAGAKGDMGRRAQNDVSIYSNEAFCARWQRLYEAIQRDDRAG